MLVRGRVCRRADEPSGYVSYVLVHARARIDRSGRILALSLRWWPVYGSMDEHRSCVMNGKATWGQRDKQRTTGRTRQDKTRQTKRRSAGEAAEGRRGQGKAGQGKAGGRLGKTDRLVEPRRVITIATTLARTHSSSLSLRSQHAHTCLIPSGVPVLLGAKRQTLLPDGVPPRGGVCPRPCSSPRPRPPVHGSS